MKFEDKYTTSFLKLSDAKENEKIELSLEAFAIGELMEELINSINKRFK